MSSEDRTYLGDMMESARRALSYVDGRSFEDFERHLMMQDAVIYRLGVIGEAALSVTAATRANIAVDWLGITNMRHRLFHGYRVVNLQIVWSTVTDDLPHLVSTIEAYLHDR